jgi:glutathione synthase/RimK-type ligase-like ATP-grasp enzyme
MVIGNRILSCRIDSQASEATKVDWRHYDFKNVEHLQIELPDEVRKKLHRFMNAIGLKYGAIDLIETPNGDFIFLEVNPSGQWGWIADFAGLPIPEAVAEMLEAL